MSASKKTKTAPAAAKASVLKSVAIAKPPKVAKAAPAPKPAPWPEKARIVVLVKENPARVGSGRFDRMERLLKFAGKPVSAFIEAGGQAKTVLFSVAKKWIKVAA
jgi:hypothetical protein